MILKGWYFTEAGNFWRYHWRTVNIRCHVARRKEGQVDGLNWNDRFRPGWYWYTVGIDGDWFSHLSGPFDSAELAAANMEAVERT